MTTPEKIETASAASRAIEQQVKAMKEAHFDALVRVRLLKDRMAIRRSDAFSS